MFITAKARVIVLLALPLGMFFIIGGGYYSRLFGPEFVEGRPSLAILNMAHLGNALAGSVSLKLIMTGYERDAAVGVTGGAIANVFLNALLIPRWGMEGVAIATEVSLIMWNVVLVLRTRWRLGIRPTALGFV